MSYSRIRNGTQLKMRGTVPPLSCTPSWRVLN